MRRGVGAVALAAVLLGTVGAVCRFTSADCRLCILPGLDCSRTELLPGFEQEVVIRGLDFPTSFAFLPGGRILVAEKDGRIRLVKNGRLMPDLFLDLRARVNTHSLRGLLAVEPAPDFERSRFVYVLYVHEDGRGAIDAPETVRVSRVTASGDRAPEQSERVILGREEGVSCNRRPAGSDCIPADGDQVGGDLAFTVDGSMLVTTGDGSSEEDRRNSLRAQDVTSLAGKLLRVTREGKGRADNPFWNGNPDDARSKVWAYGFRNPFRLTVRPSSGAPYIGDVGWNTTEEVDVAASGANFGWPCFEGPRRPRAYAGFPVCRSLYVGGPSAASASTFSYATLADRRRASVTGGIFYTDSAYPAKYRGAYFFGDWARNKLLYLRVDSRREEFIGGPAMFVEHANGPVELAVGPEGSLYYLASKVGELRRIVYRP